MEKDISKHSFRYENYEITATGVLNVREFTEREIVAEIAGTGLTIRGEGLKITDVDVSAGMLKATGTLHSMQYGGGGGGGFLKRILK